MDDRRLVVVGGGEHARVVMEAIRASEQWILSGFVDPLPCAESAARLAVPRLGDDTALPALIGAGHWLVLGVGGLTDPSARRAAVTRIGPCRWAVVVHPRAWVSPSASLAPGVVVMAHATVNSGAQLGAHALVNTNAVVEHDVTLGPFVSVGPSAVIGGGAHVDEDAVVGLGSRVREHVRVGRAALVGMGAVVVKHVPDGERVVGVPARARSATDG